MARRLFCSVDYTFAPEKSEVDQFNSARVVGSVPRRASDPAQKRVLLLRDQSRDCSWLIAHRLIQDGRPPRRGGNSTASADLRRSCVRLSRKGRPCSVVRDRRHRLPDSAGTRVRRRARHSVVGAGAPDPGQAVLICQVKVLRSKVILEASWVLVGAKCWPVWGAHGFFRGS